MTGKKYDGGKAPLWQGCMDYFPDALLAVALISKYGLEKYELEYADHNWKQVEGALPRYLDADGRHLLKVNDYDPESQMLHAAHHAWNALAALQLILESGKPLTRKTLKDMLMDDVSETVGGAYQRGVLS